MAVMPVLVIVIEVLVPVLPVLASLVAIVLAVFAVLIANLVARTESILQIVSPVLRIGGSLRWAFAIADSLPTAVGTWSISESGQESGASAAGYCRRFASA
jgi:hypothetical protein